MGLFRSRPKRKKSQSDRRAEKRKLKIGVIEHLTPSGQPDHFSAPRSLTPLSQPSYPYVPQSLPLMPQSLPLVPPGHMARSETPYTRHTPIFRDLVAPNTLPSDRKLSNVSRSGATHFDRQLSSQSSQSNSPPPPESATSQVAQRRYNKPATLPLVPDSESLYENLPCQRSPLATKPPLPHSSSIYSNIEEMVRNHTEYMPPLKRYTNSIATK